jgi:hypothetical protein
MNLKEGLRGKADANLCPETRVARWFLFEPKIPILVNFGGPEIGKCIF